MYTLQLNTADEVAVLVSAARLGSVLASGEVTDASAKALVIFVSAPLEAHAAVVKGLKGLMQSANREISAKRN